MLRLCLGRVCVSSLRFYLHFFSRMWIKRWAVTLSPQVGPPGETQEPQISGFQKRSNLFFFFFFLKCVFSWAVFARRLFVVGDGEAWCSLSDWLRVPVHDRGQQRHLQSGPSVPNTFGTVSQSQTISSFSLQLQFSTSSLSLSLFLPRRPGSSHLRNWKEPGPSAPGSPRRTRRVPELWMAPQTALDTTATDR